MWGWSCNCILRKLAHDLIFAFTRDVHNGVTISTPAVETLLIGAILIPLQQKSKFLVDHKIIQTYMY